MTNKLVLSAACWLFLPSSLSLAVPGFRGNQNMPAAPSQTRSIREFAACDGVKDDVLGVAAAFVAARNGAFTLVVDCPVFIHIGMDISRPLFIDNGTTVRFTGKGLFIIDNALVPAFVLADTYNVQLLDWRIQYSGGEPVNWETGGYYNNGIFVSKPGRAPPAYAFNDRVLTPWLTANRSIIFDRSAGNVNSPWTGPTDTSAVFFIIGNTANLNVKNLKMFVPPTADVSHFIPVCFTSWWGYNPNQTVTAKTPIDTAHVSVPSRMNFIDIDLDGYYMGWQGKYQDTEFRHVRAHRYGDLQDANGTNLGGVGKWFAPPHLFYIAYDPKFPGLENRNVHISDVIDFGVREGLARDQGGSDPYSGYANSLKFGGIDSSVDNYKSYRPDGLMDVLNCDNMTISNVEGTYDSSFLNQVYPGIRFPSVGYKRLTLENVHLTDKSPETKIPPVGSVGVSNSKQITLKNVTVDVKKYTGTKDIKPYFIGEDHHIDIKINSASPANTPKQ